MLFLITQTHTPETCPIDAGGREALHENPENLPGLKLRPLTEPQGVRHCPNKVHI